MSDITVHYMKKFEDTKGVIKSRKLKDRRMQWPKEKDKKPVE
jgi:hypothetical protein